jgi:hypothetical protein
MSDTSQAAIAEVSAEFREILVFVSNPFRGFKEEHRSLFQLY